MPFEKQGACSARERPEKMVSAGREAPAAGGRRWTFAAAAFAVPGLVALSVSAPVQAQWYVGLDAGPNFQNSTQVTSGSDNRTEYHIGAGAQAEIGYDFGAPKVEFELGYRENRIVKIGKTGSSDASGTLAATTAMINGVWGFLPESSWHPFIGAGIGGAYLQASDAARNGILAYGAHDIQFAYQGFAGVGYDITPQWGAKLQYKYLGTTDYTATATDAGSGTASYGNHSLLAGITYKFGAPASAKIKESSVSIPVRPRSPSDGDAVSAAPSAIQADEGGSGGPVDGTALALGTGPAEAAMDRQGGGEAAPAGGDGEAAANAEAPKEPETWSLHGQYTLTEQVSPGFHSPAYNGGNGNNSLNNKFQSRETQSVTAFMAVKLREGTELYVDPELFQGFGLSGSLGMGDLTNGEAQKLGSTEPKVYMARYYLKQVIGLGGSQEWQEGAPHQLAGWQDVSRLTVIAGGFAVTDFMGGNAYASDPRHDFTNWGVLQAAAWDWAADARAYTGGVFVELNQKDWALRWAGVLQPNMSGGQVVYYHGADNIDHNVELETRYKIGDHPGKLRLLGYLNQGNMGRYSQINNLVAQGMDVDAATNLSRGQWGKTKVGYVINLEQEVADEFGVFGRWSWNDGTTEEWNYTDADHSLSGGVSLKGGRWGRPDDIYGLGMAVSGISGQHQRFLANGGIGMMLGEGSLPKYQQEVALESYYAWKVFDPLTLTADYQFIANPGYNPTRGPASILGLRAHAEY